MTKAHLMCATMLAGLLAGAAHAATTATVPGNVSKWAATATSKGAASDTQRVTIAVHLALKNADALKQLVASVSKPGTAQYGRYLTAAAFRLRFAPDAADVASVKEWLSQAGMTNLHVGTAGAYVSAVATVAQLRSTFGITQNEYQVGTLTLRGNKELPSIPSALAGKIVYIEGLDDTTFLKQPQHKVVTEVERRAPAGLGAHASPATTPPPVASNLPSPYCSTYFGDANATLSTKPDTYPKVEPWLACGYTPQQVQQAYGFNRVHLDGTGITIGIVDAYASPTLMADGNQYATNHNLPALTDANFTLDVPEGIYDVDPGESCGPYGWWGEESLDLAAVHGTATGANIIYIGSRDCGTSLTTALTDAIYNKKADILTNSYGYNGEGVDPASTAMTDQSFMAAAAMGISVLFSSGDDGDLSQSNGVATGSLESDSPYVTAVGGTSLLLKSSMGVKDEYGWGTYRAYLSNAMVNSATSVTTSGIATASALGYTFDAFAFYSGAGGGISPSEAQPDYQEGVVPQALATTLNTGNGEAITLSGAQRVSPDVSMVADPYTGYLVGESFTTAGDSVNDAGCTATSSTTEYCEIAFGGTSLASPLMAGVLAVVDQRKKAAGTPVVGFANPWLYAGSIGSGTNYNKGGINDIAAPAKPVSLLRGYVTDPTRVRVITLNSVPFLVEATPFPIAACGSSVCLGLNDVFNYTTTGYDDVTGLGVPYLPALIKQ